MTDAAQPQGLPDILAAGLAVVFCGINPGLSSAQAGHHFNNGSNRFWRVLHLAGFTPMQIHPRDDRQILQYRCGLTTVVERPSTSASEVSPQEFKDAAAALERKVRRYQPAHLAFLGKAPYATLSGRREIAWGPQHTRMAGAEVWVLPNPSGLNRAFGLDELVEAYGQLRAAIGSPAALNSARARPPSPQR